MIIMTLVENEFVSVGNENIRAVVKFDGCINYLNLSNIRIEAPTLHNSICVEKVLIDILICEHKKCDKDKTNGRR